MPTKTYVSPVGASAHEVAEQRAARGDEYRAERDRLAFWTAIADEVILWRTREGISQQELARRVGTSHSAISRLESGQHSTNVDTLRRIAAALGAHMRVQFEPDGVNAHQR
jgi:ribosome-binding protein aMBF1 (putative translation factor)